MKLLRENWGESEELDNFIYLLNKRFNPYYEVILQLDGEVSRKYFAYEDAAKEYYDELKKEAEKDTFYYDGAIITINRVDITREEDEIDYVMIDHYEEDEEI